ncbi:MAG: PorV/PorQ family protein [Balneolales bacterium]|nr:PorV/PorQ family protein [Balneolales bacterium]
MKKRAFILTVSTAMFLLATLYTPTQVLAQAPKVAQAGMSWLNLPVGARSAAMGYASVAVSDDAGSFFWNPAGYAFTDGTNFFAHRTQWIADIDVSSAAISHNLGRYGIYGLNITSVDWGLFHGTQRADNDAGYVETGTFSPASSSIGFSYAYRITNEFGVGLNVKYLHERLGTTLVGNFDSPEEITARMNLFAIDFGTLYYIGFHDLRVGMSLKNFSNEEAYRAETFPLPMTFRLGLAMDVFQITGIPPMHELTLAADFIHSRDYSERVNIGAEYAFRDLFFLRGGYKFNYDIESFSMGGGVKVEAAGVRMTVEYAHVQMDVFSNVNMFSLMFGF